jgi:drug/metabolite transporter (DMT)-like permease
MKPPFEARFEKGVLFMLLSAVGLSFFTLFAKLGIESVSFFFLAFLRFIVPLILIMPYVLWRGFLKEGFQLEGLLLQLGRIGCVLIYQYGIFYYLTKESLFNATVLQNTAPLFIPFLDRIFLRYPIRKTTMFSIALSFIGIVLILNPNRGLFHWLSLIGIIAAMGLAGSQFLYGLHSKKEKNDANLFYYYLAASCCSFIVFLVIALWKGQLTFDLSSLTAAPLSFYLSLLALSVCSIFNQSFRGLAYRHGRPSVLAPFFYISVLLSGILDWLVFDRIPSHIVLLGAFFVISGGIVQYFAFKTAEGKGK